MSARSEFQFSERRFKDLFLYVVQELQDDPTFGETKLNKILFFSDFEAYRRLGKPITGAEYQRNFYGPTARRYTIMRDELLSSDYIVVNRRRIVDHVQDGYRLRDIVPNTEQFSAEEMQIVDEFILEFLHYNNTEMSDESHKRSVGWRVKNQGKTIPYSSALLSFEPLDEYAERGLDLLVSEHLGL